MPKGFRGVINGERWEVVLDGDYAVSDHGRIMRTRPGRGAIVGKLLSLTPSQPGYFRCELFQNGQPICAYIHTFVALAFIGPRPDGCQINHIDGNKLNNHWSNLEYVTAGDNMRHALDIGIHKCKFSESEVAEMRRKRASGMMGKVIAEQHGCSESNVSSVTLRRSRNIAWRNQ